MTKDKVWPVNSYNVHEVEELQFPIIEWLQWVKCGGQGAQTPAPIWAPCKNVPPPIESTKCYFMAKYNVKLVGCGMGMDFAQTWLRQMSPPLLHITTSTSVTCGSQTDVRRYSAIMGGAIGGGGRGSWLLQQCVWGPLFIWTPCTVN